MTSIDDARDPQAQRLEWMKNEFRVAQRRRREKAPRAASLPNDTDDGPFLAGPAAMRLTGIGVLRF